MKKNYSIGVHGCDDVTYFNMLLTDDQAELVKELANKCTDASMCSCQPIMKIKLSEEKI